MSNSYISKWVFISFVFVLLFNSCNEKNGNYKDESQSESNVNIVWIMSDDHSYQTLSAYDDRFTQTPNMDKIAEDGIKFTNSFVANSLCAPSRATLQTGKHSNNHGVVEIGYIFDGGQQTFPKLLQEAGYQTALIGKWHLKAEPTGYDYSERLVGQGDYYNTDFILNGDTTKSNGYVTNVITDKAINWLEHRDKEKPFSLQIHHKAAHRAWWPDTSKLNIDHEEFQVFNTFPSESKDKLNNNKMHDVPETFYDDYEGRKAAAAQKMNIYRDMNLVSDLKMFDKEDVNDRNSWFGIALDSQLNDEQRKVWDAYYNPILKKFKKNRNKMSDEQVARWKYERYMQDYLKTVDSMDDNVGRVIDYLKKNNLYDNTLIVYVSDQGMYMGEHGWFDKRFMYEESMRTPFLMKLPKGIDHRQKVSEMVQNIDWAPTILDIAGVDIPEDMDGMSLLPLVQNEVPDWRDALYYHFYAYPASHMVKRHYGIRTKRYKLIHFYEDIDEWELYDLNEDPMELNNLLYKQSGYDELRDSLKERLYELQVQYGDTVLNTYYMSSRPNEVKQKYKKYYKEE